MIMMVVLITALAVAWVLVWSKTRRRRAVTWNTDTESTPVSAGEMAVLVKDLSPMLERSPKVTVRSVIPDQGHIWSSPSGKRIYMN